MGSARMQPNSFEQLRSSLESTPWTYEFLADYVNELTRRIREDDVFDRMAFPCTSESGNAGLTAPENVASLYETLSPEHKVELRRWWHAKARREAYQYEDLRTRLSWRFFV